VEVVGGGGDDYTPVSIAHRPVWSVEITACSRGSADDYREAVVCLDGSIVEDEDSSRRDAAGRGGVVPTAPSVWKWY